MSRVEAIISDFGGVLTSPLLHSFSAMQDRSGISLEALGSAMFAIQQRNNANPLHELETGKISESAFLAALATQLSTDLGREVELHGFGEQYFAGLHPNDRLIEFMRTLRGRGLAMAICTNNVREWEPMWRSMLPVEEIFDLVIDSAFVGIRKPDPKIYEITLERLGKPAAAALLLDDVELNCDAARGLGMRAVCFRNTEQAIDDVEAALKES